MYSGTLIDELMATVERAEEQPQKHRFAGSESGYWYTATGREQAFDPNLLGVA